MRQAETARFLGEAGELLAGSLDYETTLATVARLAASVIADWCAVYLVEDDGSIRRLAMAHADRARVEQCWEVVSRFPFDPSLPHGTAKVLRTGRPDLLREITDSILVDLARDERHLEFLRGARVKSMMCVPLLARGRTLGALTFISRRLGRYTSADVAVAADFGRRAGLALDNARLFRAEREARAQLEEAIEAQRRGEERLREAQKLEAIGRLAAGVAHDFNNLLTVINGYAGLLAGGRRDARTVRFAEQIQASAARGAALTDQLLIFARKQLQQPEILDLNQVVSRMGEMLRRLLGPQVELTIDLDPRLAHVHTDPGQIEQVILNLVLNARDAARPGGRISIATAETHAGVADPTGLPPGRYASLLVRDDGDGMDAATKARLFEPFFTTKPRGRGTGLGLAIVYGVIQQANGHIVVDSAPGRGTTFTIHLPGVEGDASGRPPSPSTPALRGEGTILVAEDDEDVRSLVETVLRSHGYRVLVAPDGNEALRLARQHEGEIDLLVTDVVMPGLSGIKVAETLTGARPELPVLLISGYPGDDLDGDPIGGRGAELALLPKPFTPAALAARVAALLTARPRAVFDS